MRKIGVGVGLLLFVFVCCAHATGHTGDSDNVQSGRIALVIGNAGYANSPLLNPINDATDIAAALRHNGFEVRLLTNADRRSMITAIKNFGHNLKRVGTGLFYFAGHGMQIRGHNYLIPVMAEVEAESDVEFEAVDVNRILAKMDEANNSMNIVILDACRNNPFARSFRSMTKGLAKMDAPVGSIIAYATAPGSVAADGKGRNGVYTKHFLANINQPNTPIESVLKNVRVGVMQETGSKQVPWESSSLTGNFYFAGGSGGSYVPVQPAQPVVMAQPASYPNNQNRYNNSESTKSKKKTSVNELEEAVESMESMAGAMGGFFNIINQMKNKN